MLLGSAAETGCFFIINRSNDSEKTEGLHKDCWELSDFKEIWQLKLDSEINFVDLR